MKKTKQPGLCVANLSVNTNYWSLLRARCQSVLKVGTGLIVSQVTAKENVMWIPYMQKSENIIAGMMLAEWQLAKKNTLTRCKVKKQRRLLCETLKNLHQKYLAESGVTVSYSLFCQLRPFDVVEPTEMDRQTCQCKIHENLQFIADTLQKQGLIPTSNLEDLVKKVVCDPNSYECHYNVCDKCHDNEYPVSYRNEVMSNEIAFTQWVYKKVPRNEAAGDDQSKTTTITDKDKITCSIEDLVLRFQEQLSVYKRHQYNVYRQYRWLLDSGIPALE